MATTPTVRAKANAHCSECGASIHVSPSRLKKWVRHFCNDICKTQYFGGMPKKPRSERIEVTCQWCDQSFVVTANKASKRHNHFCCREHYFEWKTSACSSYYQRNLEAGTKQRLVRFLTAHGVGSYARPGYEDIILKVKSGFLVPGLSPHSNPLGLLALKLRKIGHTKLAQMILDGTWEQVDLWPATRNYKSREAWYQAHHRLPWEWNAREDDYYP